MMLLLYVMFGTVKYSKVQYGTVLLESTLELQLLYVDYVVLLFLKICSYNMFFLNEWR